MKETYVVTYRCHDPRGPSEILDFFYWVIMEKRFALANTSVRRIQKANPAMSKSSVFLVLSPLLVWRCVVFFDSDDAQQMRLGLAHGEPSEMQTCKP